MNEIFNAGIVNPHISLAKNCINIVFLKRYSIDAFISN